MAYAQVSAVTVQVSGGTEDIKWAERVTVDRKGKLHIYGKHGQHRVFNRGDWKGYLATATPSYSGWDDLA